MKKFLLAVIILLTPTMCYAGIKFAFSNGDGRIHLPEMHTVADAERVGQLAARNRGYYDELKRQYDRTQRTSKIRPPQFKSRDEARKWAQGHIGNVEARNMVAAEKEVLYHMYVYMQVHKSYDSAYYKNQADYYAEAMKVLQSSSAVTVPKFKSQRQATLWGIRYYGDDDALTQIQEAWRESRKKADAGDYPSNKESDLYLEAIRTMQDEDLRADVEQLLIHERFAEGILVRRAWEVAKQIVDRVGADIKTYSRPLYNRGVFWGGVYYP